MKDPSVTSNEVEGRSEYIFPRLDDHTVDTHLERRLAVHPDIDYVKVELLAVDGENTVPTGEFFIMAKARLEVLKEKYAVVAEFKGKDLLGKEYERIFNYHEVKEKGWNVVEGSFVTTDSGSGIVHMAPAYGEDDYQTCRNMTDCRRSIP